jgi:drug/metabolite transporter (DMT)-like permease
METSTRPVSTRAWHFLVLLLVGTLWGLHPALIKFAVGGALSEIETASMLMLSIVVVLGGYLALRGRMIRLTRATLTFIAIAGFLEYTAPFLATFWVAEHVDAVLLTLIIATTPIFALVVAAATGVEPASRETVLACLIGVVAMALIVVPENALPSREMLPWCLAAFATPISYACGSTYVSRNWPAEFDTAQAVFAGALGAAIMLTPFWVRPIAAGTIAANPSGASWALVLLVAAVILEMVLYMYLLRRTGPVFTNFSSFVMIASGFLAGMVLFGERPSIWIWMSMGLFVLSLATILRAPHKEGAEAPTA